MTIAGTARWSRQDINRLPEVNDDGGMGGRLVPLQSGGRLDFKLGQVGAAIGWNGRSQWLHGTEPRNMGICNAVTQL